MAILDDAKLALRITATAFDSEISDLISYAQEDLVVAGVTRTKMDAFVLDPDSDYLIKRAVITYVKAEFGWSNPDQDAFRGSYNIQKIRITLLDDYIS